MKWLLATVGEPKLAYAKLGIAEYLERIRRVTQFDWVSVKASSAEVESGLLLKKTDGCFRVVLDERGAMRGSREFAAVIQGWMDDPAVARVAVIVGGAAGHSDAMRRRADLLLGFGAATMQHELATVVLLEQIYRAHSICRGEPYHRD